MTCEYYAMLRSQAKWGGWDAENERCRALCLEQASHLCGCEDVWRQIRDLLGVVQLHSFRRVQSKIGIRIHADQCAAQTTDRHGI